MAKMLWFVKAWNYFSYIYSHIHKEYFVVFFLENDGDLNIVHFFCV